MKKPLFLVVLIVLIFSLIFNCKTTETPAVSTYLTENREPFREKEVSIAAKAYTIRDCKTYLGRDLIHSGIQPIQITIQNNTENIYFLSDNGVDIPTITSAQAAQFVTRSAIPRSIAFKVAGFIFWPFLIPGTIDGIITLKSHLDMKKDFYAKSVKEEGETLLPYSTAYRVIFLPANRTPKHFTVHLKNQKNQRFIPFQIKIHC